MKIHAAALLCIFVLMSMRAKANECSQAFNDKETTQQFIAYISALVNQKILSTRHVMSFAEGLQTGKIINPISAQEADSDSAKMLHHRGIEQYISTQKLDLNTLKMESLQILSRTIKTDHKREEIKDETRHAFPEMQFHTIKPGKIGNLEIKHSLAVMSTQVTQWQWVQIMKENPSYFSHGDESICLSVEGKPLTLRPNHPVENLTYWSALVFANRVSEKLGYEPAYIDLDDTMWESTTRAENGTLCLKPYRRVAIKFNAPDGQYKHTKGVRLPTLNEARYLFSLAMELGSITDLSQVPRFGWLRQFYQDSTHPVAQLAATTIDGQDFFDIMGNVNEWNWNERNECAHNSGESVHLNQLRLVNTGTHKGHLDRKTNGKIYPGNCQRRENYRDETIGLRLVITLDR